MFLDDELKQIHLENGCSLETSKKLLQACLRRIPDPNKVSANDFFNEIRKIEGGWKLFCSKHKMYVPNGFREFMINHFQLDERVRHVLHWN